jgi:hypothetical protein
MVIKSATLFMLAVASHNMQRCDSKQAVTRAGMHFSKKLAGGAGTIVRMKHQ